MITALQILASRTVVKDRNSNILIIGEPNSGKTAIMETVAAYYPAELIYYLTNAGHQNYHFIEPGHTMLNFFMKNNYRIFLLSRNHRKKGIN